jgi:hypothetical protein
VQTAARGSRTHPSTRASGRDPAAWRPGSVLSSRGLRVGAWAGPHRLGRVTRPVVAALQLQPLRICHLHAPSPYLTQTPAGGSRRTRHNTLYCVGGCESIHAGRTTHPRRLSHCQANQTHGPGMSKPEAARRRRREWKLRLTWRQGEEAGDHLHVVAHEQPSVDGEARTG